MDKLTSTRRSLIKAVTGLAAYGAGVTTLSVGAVVATATNPAKAATHAAASPELLRLIADYIAADAKLDQFYAVMWNPRVDRSNALIEAVPHTVVTIPNGTDDANPLTLTTANKHDVARCKGILSIPRATQSQSASWQRRYDAAVKIMAGDERRTKAIARIREQTGMIEADRLEKEMDQSAGELLDKVTDFPVRSLIDLQTKFAFQRERGRNEEAIVDMVASDLSALLGGEAHA